jgi:hypothetical protein
MCLFGSLLLRNVHKFILGYMMSEGNRDISVGIATGYGLDDRGVGVRFPVESIILSSPFRPDRL